MYTYNPAEIETNMKDRIRFELGDTLVQGESDTTALTDEEIYSAIKIYPTYKMAKFKLLESVYRRFSYEVTTRTGPLTLELQERAKLWQEEYFRMKKEMDSEVCGYIASKPKHSYGKPYFYNGMHKNGGA